MTILGEEISIIRQSKSRQAKASSSRGSERPASQSFVELIVDVRKAADSNAAISVCQQCSLDYPHFCSFLDKFCIFQAEDLEQLHVISTLQRRLELAHLPQRLRQDLKLNRIVGGVFDELVARSIGSGLGNVANAHGHTSTKPFALLVK